MKRKLTELAFKNAKPGDKRRAEGRERVYTAHRVKNIISQIVRDAVSTARASAANGGLPFCRKDGPAPHERGPVSGAATSRA